MKFTYKNVNTSSDDVNRSGYFWGFERVVCWEMDGEEENSTGVWTITLSHKGS